MRDSYSHPALRWPIDIRFEEAGDEKVLLVNCPLGISKTPLLLVPAVAPIIASFEGKLSLDEIVAQFSQYGVTRELVSKLISLLDENLFLASPRFYEAERAVKEEFRISKVRPAILAGAGYSSDAGELRRMVEQYIGVGKIQAAPVSPGSLIALVSPHIDYRRGGACYGKTWRQIQDHKADLYILLGTAHQYSPHLFHLSQKSFATPLGVLPCDLPFVNRVAERYGVDRSFADEFLHRREHSLELQLPFLQSVTSGGAVVPILVGGFHQMLSARQSPRNFEIYEAFAQALAYAVKEREEQGKRVCFIAGVDMAHIGQHFGDAERLSPELLQEVERRDRLYLDAIGTLDAEQLFLHMAEDQDARKVCGFPSTYLLLDVLTRLGVPMRAEVFDYRQAVNYETDCAVTFAGAGVYRV